MKRFTQKFFLLAMGLMLSMGASAQGSDGIAHRYPEFTFTAEVTTLNSKKETFTFTMPAWDAFVSTEVPAKTGLGYRMQLLENPKDKQTPARVKIVAPRVFSHEKSAETGDYWFASSPSTVTITKPDGTKLENVSTSTVTYGDIFGLYNEETNQTGVASGDLNKKPFAENIQTTSSGKGEENNLTIQSTRTIQGGKWQGYIFKIVEIGEGAFRNSSSGSGNILKIEGTVTIPNTIEKIEASAFRNGGFKKVVFEEGSTITTIEKATFEGCNKMEEVNIPATVTKIEGTAFGNCGTLSKIVFEGDVPEMTKVDEEPLYPKATTYPGPYSVFQGAVRFHASINGPDLTPSKCIIEVPLGKAKSYAVANDGLLQDFALSSKITLGDNGKMTYCSEEDFTVMQYNTAYTSNDDKWENGALKAYYVKNSVDDVDTENGKVYLTQITGESKIPGWSETEDFGVFFRGEANQSYSIFYPYDKMSTTLTMAGTTNCLKGVVTNTRITIPDPEDPEEEFSYFIFSKSTGNFRRITSSGTCQANKAYIKIKDGGNPSMGTEEESKELAISFPEETGIATLETKSVQNDAWYTLQGVQVNQPQKGVFIKNGKKFVIK